jgi:hypothetical protein
VREAGFDGILSKLLDRNASRDQIKRLLAGDPVWEPQ